MDGKVLGGLGEEMAAGFLYGKGYDIIERNFNCRMGEVDIVAMKDDVLYMVEVKTRASLKMGTPSEYITRNKILTMQKIGEFYAKIKGYRNLNIDTQIIEIMINHIDRIY